MHLGSWRADRGGMTETSYKQLRRSRTDKVLGGVCGGFARYLGIDPVAARVLYVLATFLSGGALILAYAIFWIAMPEETSPWPAASYPPAGPAPSD
jgi:phage shock protein C